MTVQTLTHSRKQLKLGGVFWWWVRVESVVKVTEIGGSQRYLGGWMPS